MDFDPAITFKTNWPAYVRVVCPGEATYLPQEPTQSYEVEHKTYEVSLYQFMAEAGDRLKTRWTSERVVYVDTKDYTNTFRKFRVSINCNEDLGTQKVYLNENEQRWVLTDSWRDRYTKMPENNTMSLAEFATWYKTTSKLNVEQARLAPVEDNYVVLKDNKTVLQRQKKQAVLITSAHDDFSEKCLNRPWKNEEDIIDVSEVMLEDKLLIRPKLNSVVEEGGNEEDSVYCDDIDDEENIV